MMVSVTASDERLSAPECRNHFGAARLNLLRRLLDVRIRTIKPAFWHDSVLARLPEATRLFYVGLWMVADDAGWFRWDPAEVANDLYGYDSRSRREAKVTKMMQQLVAAQRVHVAPCAHGLIPKLAEHQHLAAATRQVRTIENEHLRMCVSRQSPPKPAETREDPQIPGTVMGGKGGDSEVKERAGIARPREMTIQEVEEERRRLETHPADRLVRTGR